MTLLDHLARLESLCDAHDRNYHGRNDASVEAWLAACREYEAALDPDTVRALVAVVRAAQEYFDVPCHGTRLEEAEDRMEVALKALAKMGEIGTGAP